MEKWQVERYQGGRMGTRFVGSCIDVHMLAATVMLG